LDLIKSLSSLEKSGYRIGAPEFNRFSTALEIKFDATKAGDRWDGNKSKEKDYYAYFLRNNRGGYPISPGGPDLGDENAIGYKGDSFTYRGITVSLVESGDYDTVRITSANGATPFSQDDEDKYVVNIGYAREPEGVSFCGCCGCFPNPWLD
jgi:hypothetical protein